MTAKEATSLRRMWDWQMYMKRGSLFILCGNVITSRNFLLFFEGTIRCWTFQHCLMTLTDGVYVNSHHPDGVKKFSTV